MRHCTPPARPRSAMVSRSCRGLLLDVCVLVAIPLRRLFDPEHFVRPFDLFGYDAVVAQLCNRVVGIICCDTFHRLGSPYEYGLGLRAFVTARFPPLDDAALGLRERAGAVFGIAGVDHSRSPSAALSASRI